MNERIRLIIREFRWIDTLGPAILLGLKKEKRGNLLKTRNKQSQIMWLELQLRCFWSNVC